MALKGRVFLDTSVLLAGVIDFGGPSRAAQAVMDGVADGVLADAHTAWHCCLEFYSVATRLPEEYRLSPADAVRLIEHEILDRVRVHQLPAPSRGKLLRAAAQEGVVGGRIYDAHIAEVAHSVGADVVVTENPRHFMALQRSGTQVLSAAEFVRTGAAGRR